MFNFFIQGVHSTCKLMYESVGFVQNRLKLVCFSQGEFVPSKSRSVFRKIAKIGGGEEGLGGRDFTQGRRCMYVHTYSRHWRDLSEGLFIVGGRPQASGALQLHFHRKHMEGLFGGSFSSLAGA